MNVPKPIIVVVVALWGLVAALVMLLPEMPDRSWLDGQLKQLVDSKDVRVHEGTGIIKADAMSVAKEVVDVVKNGRIVGKGERVLHKPSVGNGWLLLASGELWIEVRPDLEDKGDYVSIMAVGPRVGRLIFYVEGGFGKRLVEAM